jgi:hypothetical protein
MLYQFIGIRYSFVSCIEMKTRSTQMKTQHVIGVQSTQKKGNKHHVDVIIC